MWARVRAAPSSKSTTSTLDPRRQVEIVAGLLHSDSASAGESWSVDKPRNCGGTRSFGIHPAGV